MMHRPPYPTPLHRALNGELVVTLPSKRGYVLQPHLFENFGMQMIYSCLGEDALSLVLKGGIILAYLSSVHLSFTLEAMQPLWTFPQVQTSLDEVITSSLVFNMAAITPTEMPTTAIAKLPPTDAPTSKPRTLPMAKLARTADMPIGSR